MSRKRVLKVQKRLERIEKDLDWLKEESERPDAADRYCITGAHVEGLQSEIRQTGKQAAKMHEFMRKCAGDSTDGEVAAFGGPKGEDP